MNIHADIALVAAQVITNAFKNDITATTKVFNEVAGSTAVDAFMDQAAGYGHRVVHGHSLEYLPHIFNEFGIKGVGDAMVHWARDLSSPHGVPIPFANELRELLGLNFKQTIHWMSFNIADVIGGSISFIQTYQNYLAITGAVKVGYMAPSVAYGVAFSGLTKVVAGVLSTNPLSISSGIADLGLLACGLIPALTLGTSYFSSVSQLASSSYIVGLSGLATSFICSSLLTYLIYDKPTLSDYMRNIVIGGAVGAAITAGGVMYGQSAYLTAGLSAISSAAAVMAAEYDQISNFFRKKVAIDSTDVIYLGPSVSTT